MFLLCILLIAPRPNWTATCRTYLTYHPAIVQQPLPWHLHLLSDTACGSGCGIDVAELIKGIMFLQLKLSLHSRLTNCD